MHRCVIAVSVCCLCQSVCMAQGQKQDRDAKHNRQTWRERVRGAVYVDSGVHRENIARRGGLFKVGAGVQKKTHRTDVAAVRSFFLSCEEGSVGVEDRCMGTIVARVHRVEPAMVVRSEEHDRYRAQE